MTVGISNVTATWLDSNIDYTGIGINVVDLGHGANSRIINLKSGYLSKFSVDTDSNAYADNFLGINANAYIVQANVSISSDLIFGNTTNSNVVFSNTLISNVILANTIYGNTYYENIVYGNTYHDNLILANTTNTDYLTANSVIINNYAVVGTMNLVPTVSLLYNTTNSALDRKSTRLNSSHT